MPQYGAGSLARLATLHPQLQELLKAVLADGIDHTIVCGHRSKPDQDAAVAAGRSKTPWPTSKHNSYPSVAVDVEPYPILHPEDVKDIGQKIRRMARIAMFIGYCLGRAKGLGIQLRAGIDWNGDWVLDEAFMDSFHIELKEPQ